MDQLRTEMSALYNQDQWCKSGQEDLVDRLKKMHARRVHVFKEIKTLIQKGRQMYPDKTVTEIFGDMSWVKHEGRLRTEMRARL